MRLSCGQQRLPRLPPLLPAPATTVLSVCIGLLQAPPDSGLTRCFSVHDGLSSQHNILCSALPKHLLQSPSFLRPNSILFCVLYRVLFIVPLGGQSKRPQQGSGTPSAWLTSSFLAYGPSWEQPLCKGGVARSLHPQVEGCLRETQTCVSSACTALGNTTTVSSFCVCVGGVSLGPDHNLDLSLPLCLSQEPWHLPGPSPKASSRSGLGCGPVLTPCMGSPSFSIAQRSQIGIGL